MSFDYLIDPGRDKPDIKTTPLQPFLIFHTRNIFQATDEFAKKRYIEEYFSFLENGAYSCLKHSNELLENFELHKNRFDSFSMLPENSWWINLKFTLETAYIARDDTVFSPSENPPRIEKVIGLPYVSPASWKGLLRGELIFSGKDQDILHRLFGTDQAGNGDNTQQGGQQGRLCFFPTFFNKIAVDMINPHKRETKTDAHGPIKFEVVPPGTKGELQIVYVPFGQDSNWTKSQEDIITVGTGIQELLLNAGISAKRNIGYGIVKDDLDSGSFFQINNQKFQQSPASESEPKEKSENALNQKLFQENGEIIPFDQFKALFSKKTCKEEFGNKDRRKVYQILEQQVLSNAEMMQNKDQLEKFSINNITELCGQLNSLREA